MQPVRKLFVTAAVVMTVGAAWADVPRLISYQGRLASGATGTVDLEIDIHKSATGFSSQFTELHTNVPVSNGVFSILIGSETSGGVPEPVYNQTTRWIGISVDGAPELLPRTQFTLVPFSARALHADGLTIPENDLSIALEISSTGDMTFFDSNGSEQMLLDMNGLNGAAELEVLGDNHATTTVALEGAGGTGNGGRVRVFDDAGDERASVDGGTGTLELSTGTATTARLEPDRSGSPGATLTLTSPDGLTNLVEVQGSETSTTGPQIFLRDADGTATFDLDAEFNADGGAQMSMRTGVGIATVLLDAQNSAGAAEMQLDDAAGTLRLQIDASDPPEGLMTAYSDAGNEVFRLKSDQSGDNGQIDLVNENGITAFEAIAFASTTGGRLTLRDGSTGTTRIQMFSDNGSRDAEINLRDASTSRVRLYSADEGRVQILDGGLPVVQMMGAGGGEIQLLQGSTPVLQLIADDINGDSRIVTDVLQINAGSDLSERFDIRGDAQAGMVVSIDPTTPGGLVISDAAYDRRVAGIVSGAGGVKPGMLMGQVGTIADGEHPVALTGRVWTWCDAGDGPIVAGDLLTTSATPGHAMAVADHDRAGGAIIGKAMTDLASGRGLVLVLVNLQ